MKLRRAMKCAGWLCFPTIAAVISAPCAALATVLNFAGLAAAGSRFNPIGGSYAQGGFTLSGSDLYTWQSSNANLPDLSAADTSLFEYYADATDTLTRGGGGTFTLTSIALAPDRRLHGIVYRGTRGNLRELFDSDARLHRERRVSDGATELQRIRLYKRRVGESGAGNEYWVVWGTGDGVSVR
jgi:hypothetical protein